MLQLAILSAAGLGFLGMGLVALVAPARVTAQFGIPVLGSDGRNEVRAVYGGFGVAIAGTFAAAVVEAQWRVAVAAMVAVALGGMAAGRLLSALLDRRIGGYPLLYGGIEAISAALLAFAAQN